MNILIAATVGAALPWLITLFWQFVYWDFGWDRRDAWCHARMSVIFAVLAVVIALLNGGVR